MKLIHFEKNKQLSKKIPLSILKIAIVLIHAKGYLQIWFLVIRI